MLIGLVIVISLITVAIFAPQLALYGSNQSTGEILAKPSFEYPFGTNIQGRDLFSRVILGSRNSLGVAFPSVMIAVAIGLPLGMFSGYIGGAFDRLFVRLFDILFAMPTILFAIALVAYLGPSIRNLILTIAALYIPRVALVARAPTLTIKTREYVLAAKMFGSGTFRILRKHIFPNIFAPVVVGMAPELGLDPAWAAVWFGVLFVMNIQIYFLSPPFGPACFWLKSVAPPDITLQEIFMAVLPFIALQIIGMMLVLFIPDIALWFPKYLSG